MDLIGRLRDELGEDNVLTGADCAAYARDWTHSYEGHPLAVVRPGATAEVAAVVRLAAQAGVPVVPVSGNTGLMGGAIAEDGQILVSLERMTAIRDIRRDARVAVVEAGAVLQSIHEAVEAEDLVFPLTFGARGQARIGGALSTNAGGSNVLRHGNARALCLGIEVVLPTGEVLDMMGALHKDNSGYDLRDLFIGAEGTLGIVTAAVLKLKPKPRAYATAMVAVPALTDALALLNRLQEETGGAVEAFEYMPGFYIEQHLKHVAGARPPFERMHDINVMVEIAATAPRDAVPDATGEVPVAARLEELLAEMLEEGRLLDAVVARSEAQRREMWERRERAAELSLLHHPLIIADVAVPLDLVATFLDEATRRIAGIDAGARDLTVAHLGDGNIHYVVWPTESGKDHQDRIMQIVEDLVVELRGSFSAEHGVGLGKLNSMQRRKDPLALDVMRRIKTALDPQGIMNPGKVLPAPAPR